jgi:hypothetical protein
MPRIVPGAIRRFTLLLIAAAILTFVLPGCVSDKECWEPDFSAPPVQDKAGNKTEKKK